MSVDRISEMAEKQLGQAFVQFIYFEMWVTEALDLGGEAGSGQTVAYALFSFKQPAIFTNIYTCLFNILLQVQTPLWHINTHIYT